MVTRYAVPTLIVVLLGVFAYAYLTARSESLSARAERDAWADSTRAITATARVRMAELVSQRAIADSLQADLVSALRKLDAKPNTVVRTVIEARPETLTVALRDTIIGSTPQWTFNDRFGPYRASGAVWPESRKMTLAIERDPISFAVVVARTKAGNWLGVVNVPDSTLRVGTIDVQVLQPEQPGWLSRNRGKIGLIVGGVVSVVVGSL